MEVAQGCVLGPLLFVRLVNDLSSFISNRRGMVANYDDDTNTVAVESIVNDVLELGWQWLGLALKWLQENNLILMEKDYPLLFSHLGVHQP